MDKKKLLFIGIGVALLLIVIIIISLISPKGNSNSDTGGGGNNSGKTSSYVTDVSFAKNMDKNGNPIGKSDIFSVEDSSIYAFITINGLPSGVNVSYQWYDIKGDSIVFEEQKPQTKSVFSGVTTTLLSKSDRTNWGVGSYEFRVLFNQKIYFKKNYAIKTVLDIQRDQVSAGVKNLQLATKVDLQGKIVGSATNVFVQDDEDIFASMTYEKLPISVKMEAKWKYIPDGRLIGSYTKTVIGSGTFAFGIDASRDSWIPTKKWVVGKYKLEIYLNGDLFKELLFEVE